MAKKESEKSKATRCARVTVNVSLIVAFIFFILIPVMQSYSASSHFIMNPSAWNLVKGFTDFFIVGFAFIYLMTSLIVLFRFYFKRRLCRMDNCSFYIFTIGIFALSMVGNKYINEKSD